MQRRHTLALFVIALALVAYYLAFERGRGDGDAASRLVAIDPNDVEIVTILRDDGTLRFRRVDAHWEMVQPLADLADASAVMRLVAAVADAVIEGAIGEPDDLGPFGLDSPVTIVLEGPPSEPVSVLVGDYTVDRAYVYAMRAGASEVFLVPTAIRRYAGAATEDYRYKRVATFDVSVVDSFHVHSPRGTMRWQRNGRGWVSVAGDDTIRGNTPAVEGVLRRLRGLRAIGFPAAGESTDDGRYVVRVFRAPPVPPQEIRVRPRGSSALVRVEPGGRAVEVDSTVMEVFAFTVGDLREKHLLQFEPAEVARVELETPHTLATLVRTGNVWGTPNPALGDLDPGRVRAALGAARALEFERARRGARRLGAGTFRLALFDDRGTIIDELRASVTPGDTLALVTSQSSGVVAEVSADRLEQLEERFKRIQSP